MRVFVRKSAPKIEKKKILNRNIHVELNHRVADDSDKTLEKNSVWL